MERPRKAGLASAKPAGFMNASGSVEAIGTAPYSACARSSGVSVLARLDSPSSDSLFPAECNVAIDEWSGNVP
jgi:hypothetical protein